MRHRTIELEIQFLKHEYFKVLEIRDYDLIAGHDEYLCLECKLIHISRPGW